MKIKLGQVCISRTECRRVPIGPNARMHWARRHRWNKAWGEEVWARVRQNYPQLQRFDKCAIIITSYTIQPMDADNLAASMKPVIDGLKGLVIRDDNPELCEMRFKTIKVGHKEDEYVELEVIER